MILFRTVLTSTVLIGALPGIVDARVSLRATRHSQVIQNERADADNLSRIKDETMLQRFVRLKLLEPVPKRTGSYYLHNVRPSNRYARPWVKLFLARVSRQFHTRFGKRLRVTSLVRTASYQRKLRRRNGNAAPISGAKRSTHLTGACLDISKKGMSRAERDWMRRVLASLRQKGHLFAVEEFKQPNFHVMVYRNYPEHVEQLVQTRKARGQGASATGSP